MELANIFTDITIRQDGEVLVSEAYPLVIDIDTLRGHQLSTAHEVILTAVRKRNLVPNSMTIELNEVRSVDEKFNTIYAACSGVVNDNLQIS